jgi:hypothetical protein
VNFMLNLAPHQLHFLEPCNKRLASETELHS